MRKIILFICFLFLFQTTWGQLSTLRPEIEKILAGKKLKVGLVLVDLSNGDTLSIRGNDRFPMQSIFKLHLALAVLHEVDQGRFTLSDSIRFRESELYSHLWSPIQKAYPDGDACLTLSEVLRYTLQQSDNSGCDKLFQLAGGPKKVDNYIHRIGIKQTHIENNEFELQSDWNRQFNNYTTPFAAIELLKKIERQSLLSPKSQQFLWQTLLGTTTGTVRQKLPTEVQIAYKTGFSGQNEKGETAANNNIGILILPDNRKIAYAIFITASTEKQEVNYGVIADIIYLCTFAS